MGGLCLCVTEPFNLGCHTRYYHNYYVHKNASARTYYTQSPRYVHSTEHIFIDKETCELFSSMMVASW